MPLVHYIHNSSRVFDWIVIYSWDLKASIPRHILVTYDLYISSEFVIKIQLWVR